ncbi:hypothetical protein B0T24DRAFT_33185 [Lasiosphaeria ovina]|uniref:Uncharacterized protein n=1 Tax=Lasiosphaeria ovina TaxID=92902 RepID=A0AAE0TXD6_9PEZI|nr:hypothetical protein B0T24DRAFT_33185 [Lasiosphaeria ovina]
MSCPPQERPKRPRQLWVARIQERFEVWGFIAMASGPGSANIAGIEVCEEKQKLEPVFNPTRLLLASTSTPRLGPTERSNRAKRRLSARCRCPSPIPPLPALVVSTRFLVLPNTSSPSPRQLGYTYVLRTYGRYVEVYKCARPEPGSPVVPFDLGTPCICHGTSIGLRCMDRHVRTVQCCTPSGHGGQVGKEPTRPCSQSPPPVTGR